MKKAIFLTNDEEELVIEALQRFVDAVEDPSMEAIDPKTREWRPAKTVDQMDAQELLKRLEGGRC